MASTTAFDELNILSVDEADENAIKSQIRRYIEEMELPSDEKERRIALAIDLEKMFRNLFLITTALTALEKPLSDEREYLCDYAYRHYMDVAREHKITDEFIQRTNQDTSRANGNSVDYNGIGYVEQYAKQTTTQIVDTTILHQADSYYRSLQRSVFLGENEANALANYEKEQLAIQNGYTQKMWLTKFDNKVRHTHKIVNREKIGIFDTFHVGNSLMLFPKDTSLDADAKEIINCRCVCRYLDKNNTNITDNGYFKEENVYIPKSVGAMLYQTLVKDLLTGEEYRIAEGTEIENVLTFAGKGSKNKYHKAYIYQNKLGGKLSDWKHTKGDALLEVDGELVKAEIHWSENKTIGTGMVDPFIKKWLE